MTRSEEPKALLGESENSPTIEYKQVSVASSVQGGEVLEQVEIAFDVLFEHVLKTAYPQVS